MIRRPLASHAVSVPGTTEGVRRAAEAFETFGVAQGMPAQVRWRFLVALDEILSNIVRHGLRGSPGTIDLTFRLDADVAVVDVVDATAPFNPLLAPPAQTVAPLEERHPGGLGITLVQALMDQVRYERRDERNHLTLTGRLRHADQ
jgi:serine/threonine-protein kinase RsbW